MEKFSLNFDFDHVGTSISPLKVSYVPSIYGTTVNHMYWLTSCGVYSTFEVENALQIEK